MSASNVRIEIASLRRGQVNLEKRTVPLSHTAVAVLRTALANPMRQH